jgi:adenylate cyclase
MANSHRFGRFELNSTTRQLLVDERPAVLGARAFDVLLALVERRDRIVPKDELMGLVWPGLVVEDNNLQVQVSALRKVLGPAAIKTVAGRGYQFSLECIDDVGQSSSANAGRLSVVVLPFQNLTGDPTQEYVADGLTAALTSDLSRIRDAFVVSAATAFTYKDKTVGVQRIGKELGVDFVLHGGVQRSGTKLRITAQLADAISNAQLWSESFEGDQSDLFAMQDRVTTLVGNSIGREMVIVAARKCETSRTNVTAADLLLRARALTLRPISLDNLRHVEVLCRQALALEPENSSAMVRLANSLAYQASNFSDQMEQSIQEKKYLEGRDLALKVKQIDPDNPNVYPPIAAYAMYRGDWESGLRATEKRLLLDPKNPSAYNNLAVRFYHAGNPKRSIELLTQAMQMDPKHATDLVLAGMGRAYFMLGDNDTAIEWLSKSIEQNPSFAHTYAYLAMAYVLRGDDVKARDAAAELRRLAPNFKLTEYQPDLSQPSAYKKFYEQRLAPAWRKAGLPE